MMKALSLILASLSLASCSSSSVVEEPSTPAPLLQVSHPSKHGDVFAFDLFREMASTQQGNVTLSPASLERLLLLLREGAAGDTHSSLDKLPLPMMLQQTKFRYAEGEGWQAVALDYDTQGRKGEAGFFIGILPKGSAHDFAQKLTVQKYNAIRQALAQAKYQEVLVFLPKMDLDSGIVSLNAPLKKLGLATMFSDRADFRRFSDEPLMVSDVVQRCHVITNEKETIAAAVTGAIIEESCMPFEEIKEIRFDRPFIWLIGDLNTPAPPYFIGLYGKP